MTPASGRSHRASSQTATPKAVAPGLPATARASRRASGPGALQRPGSPSTRDVDPARASRSPRPARAAPALVQVPSAPVPASQAAPGLASGAKAARAKPSHAAGPAAKEASKTAAAAHATEAQEEPEQSDPFPFHRDGWINKGAVLLFVVAPLVAFGYAIYSFWGVGVGLFEILLLVGMWTVTGLAISLGFHRMLTHRAFHARAPTRFVLLTLATMSMQGPPADWAATHIRHHAKADREGDPHSPLEGFWHAHFGWLLRSRFVRSGLAHDKIMADPVVRFVQNTWVLWATLGLVIPGLIGWAVLGGLWGFFSGFLWGGLVRVFIGHHITWSVNSLGHMIGTRPFQSPDKATNSWFLALFSWGEGWHNNHHAFPRSAHIGMRWYQVDFGKYTLGLLRLMGQIKHVWLPSKEERRARRAKKSRSDA